MRLLSPTLSALISAASLAASSGALAHASLVKSMPAADSSASNVRTLSLTFSDKVVEKLSGVEIVMTGMPGMTNHAPMKVAGFKTVLATDGKTMTLSLPRALPAGTYQLSWHAVTGDGHRIEGGYNFSAK